MALTAITVYVATVIVTCAAQNICTVTDIQVGTHTITIDGVKELKPATHATLADRIVSGTWAFAAAMTKFKDQLVPIIELFGKFLDLQRYEISCKLKIGFLRYISKNN